jgi:hypothetical protein
MTMTKRAQKPNKPPNLGLYDLFSGVETANEIQSTEIEPEIKVKIPVEKEYKNSLEVNILTPSCLNVLRKRYQVDFENGKYFIRW